MKITIVADGIEPYVSIPGISTEAAGLAVALKRAGHDVSCIIPFNEQIDTNAFSLARRLMPIKFETAGTPHSCIRYDGRTPDGVEVMLLDVGGDEDAASPFSAAATAIVQSFSQLPEACISLGARALDIAETCRNGPPDIADMCQIARMVPETADQWESAAQAADRVAFARRPLPDGVENGVVISTAGPLKAPATIDKRSSKTRFQMASGLPVRDDVPLVLVGALPESALRDALSRDIQIATTLSNDTVEAIRQNYTDRLVVITADDASDALAAADGAITGSDLSQLHSALAFGAVPIADRFVGDDAVNLEPSLQSGSAILTTFDDDGLRAGLGRLLGAFQLRDAFDKLTSRLPSYAVTWEKSARHYEQLIEEVLLEKKQHEQK